MAGNAVQVSYNKSTPITPSDSVDFQERPDAIYVGAAGNVSIVNGDGSVATFIAPPVGTVLPVSPRRVNATLTTASSLIGLKQV